MRALSYLDGFDGSITGIDPMLLILAALFVPVLVLVAAIVVFSDRAMSRQIAREFDGDAGRRGELPAMPRFRRGGRIDAQ